MKFLRISRLLFFVAGGSQVIKKLNSSPLAAGTTTESAQDRQATCTSTVAEPQTTDMERPKRPREEAEILLREAARLAVEEDKKVVLHVTIKGSGAWIIDAGGMKEAPEARASQARVHLTYASADVFLGLAHKSIDPRFALVTGRLSFRGEKGLGIRLGMCIRKALELRVNEKSEVEKDKLGIALRNKWQRNEDSPACPVFRQGFEERYGVAFQHRRPFFSGGQKPHSHGRGDRSGVSPRCDPWTFAPL